MPLSGPRFPLGAPGPIRLPMPGRPDEGVPRMSEPVLLEVRDGVATVTLNRPETYNSLNLPAKVLLLEILQSVATNAEARAVVLTGAGRGFCVGQDLNEIQPEASAKVRFSTVADHYGPLATLLATMDKPVIAAVNGPAAGAGLSLALCADLRIAAEKATFTTAFSAIALSPDTGMSWHLPRLVGATKAAELLMLSPTLSAPDALSLGLVSQVVPADDLAATAHETAARLAAGPTLAFAAIRRLLRFAEQHDLVETMAEEHVLIERAGDSADHCSAVQAFLEKRKPEFQGR